MNIIATHMLTGDKHTFDSERDCASGLGIEIKDVKRTLKHGGSVCGYELVTFVEEDDRDYYGDGYE